MKKSVYLEITPFFPTEKSFRGPYIYDQVKAIERNSNYDVIVIKTVSVFSKEPTTYTYNGVKVYNFKVIDFPSAILPGLFHTVNLHRFERFLKKIVGIIPQQIAFVHGHVAYPAGALAVEFGKRHNIKSFIQHHGLDVMQLSNGRLLKGRLKELNNLFVKKRFLKSVNGASINIGVSQKVLDRLHDIDGYAGKREYVLYNGVDTKKFYKKDVKKDRDIFTIGCIGNFWRIKDQMTLLKALNILVNEKKITDIKVIFVGSGPTLDECKKYCNRQGLQNYVEFRKEIDHTQLNDFYNTLDLFVLPSFYEALGCVYTEALQVGVPIVGVRGQGIEELIRPEDKEMMLIDKSDFIRLSNIMESFILKTYYIDNDYNFDINPIIIPFIKEIIK